MNTIPIIFNEKEVPYTVIGGNKTDTQVDEPLFSVIVLNRGGRYFSDSIFDNLKQYKFKSIFSVGNSQPVVNIETVANKFPEIKFITPLEKITFGEMVNICASESNAQYLLVLWNDTVIEAQGFAGTMLEQLYTANRVCTAPALLNSKGMPIFNQIVPVLQDSIFSTQQFSAIQDKTPTLYPFDFIGIYNRKKLIDLAGFDYTIKNPYWQVLDFGMRSKLWGNEINIATSFKIRYISNTPEEDISADEYYRMFFLKNLAYTMRNKEAVLQKRLFFDYKKNSGQNFFDALKQFKDAKIWIALNKNRFEKSAHQIISEWEPVI
ncbi:MAG: hypothetical protein CR988_01585 [Treponema sp.]|nr:MAG: hypothetical protein CR988_01585 [Treponema sp.]